MQSSEKINSMRSKGVNVDIIPHCTAFHESLSSHKIWSVSILRLLSFTSSTRRRKRRTGQFVKITIAHIVDIKFDPSYVGGWWLVNFDGYLKCVSKMMVKMCE